jgi:hypothetical protein
MRSPRLPALLVAALLAAMLPCALLAAPAAPASARARPGCEKVPGTRWPGSDDRLKDCTGGNPKTDKAEQVLAALEGLDPNKSGPVLEKAGATFFYFRDRAAADEYFKATWPYRLYKGFQAGNARCGETYYSKYLGRPLIASSVFEHCSVKGAPANRNLAETALHEAGHAYDFALAAASDQPFLSPSTSKGFRAEVSADLAAADKTWTEDGKEGKDGQQAQWRYVCFLFSTVRPDALEVALSAGHGDPEGAVCEVQAGKGIVPAGRWQKSSPSAIAAAKMPYFTGPDPAFGRYADVWAQLFALHTGRTGDPALLPFADHVLAILLPCANDVLGAFQASGKPPVTYQEGCPHEPADAFHER